METTKHFIYKLIDPITNEIRYIGQTKDLKDRLSRHLQKSYLEKYDKNTHKSRWIKQLLKKELTPIMEVIEECDSSSVNDREIFWIKNMRENGHRLTNLSNGGEVGVDWNGRKHSSESIEKIKKSKDKYKIKITQYDLNGTVIMEYDSLGEAAEKSGFHIYLISNCCKKKTHYTVGGDKFWRNSSSKSEAFTFRYSGDEFDYVPYNKHIQSNSKRVCKYNLNGELVEIYDSIKEAADSNISSDSNIRSCCKRKINKKTGEFIVVKGHTYRLYDETNGENLIN